MPATALYQGVPSVLLHALALSVQTFCIARRSFALSSLTWGRACPFFAFCVAWLFIILSMIIEHAVGTWENRGTCIAMQILCLTLYSIFKGLVCCFLAERAYIVWNSSTTKTRSKSKVYYVAILVVLGYGALIALTIVVDIDYNTTLDSDGSCIVPAKDWLMIVVITCDLLATTVLTVLFTYPLLKFHMSPQLKRMAKHALISSALTMAVSTANVSTTFAFHGREPVWICMMLCVTDLTVSSAVLYWLTVGSDAHTPAHSWERRSGSGARAISGTIPSFRVPTLGGGGPGESNTKNTPGGREKPGDSLFDIESGLGGSDTFPPGKITTVELSDLSSHDHRSEGEDKLPGPADSSSVLDIRRQ